MDRLLGTTRPARHVWLVHRWLHLVLHGRSLAADISADPLVPSETPQRMGP